MHVVYNNNIMGRRQTPTASENGNFVNRPDPTNTPKMILIIYVKHSVVKFFTHNGLHK